MLIFRHARGRCRQAGRSDLTLAEAHQKVRAQTNVLEADLERATKRDSLEGDLQGQRNGSARKADNAPVWLGSQSVV